MSTRKSTSRYSGANEKNPKRPRVTKPTFMEVGPKFGGGRGKRETYMRAGNDDDEQDKRPFGVRANSQFSDAYAIRSPPHSPRRVTSLNNGIAKSPLFDDPLSSLNAPTITENRFARRTRTGKSVPAPSAYTDGNGSVGAQYIIPDTPADKQDKQKKQTKKRRFDYTRTADSLDYHDSAKGMLAERLTRSRSRSLEKDLESLKNDAFGAKRTSTSPSLSSLSSLSSLPSASSGETSPILINSDSPRKADPPKNNRSKRPSPTNFDSADGGDDRDDLIKPVEKKAKTSPISTWKTGEEKRGGRRPVTFKKATYGAGGRSGASTVPYAKELMKSHPFEAPLSRSEKLQKEREAGVAALSKIAQRANQNNQKISKKAGRSLAENEEVVESQGQDDPLAESSFINPREKFGFGIAREVDLKRLSDDDLDDDDLLRKSRKSTPKRRKFAQSPSPGIEKIECQACNEPLPVNFLDTWKDGRFKKGHVPLLEWMDICTEHKAVSLRGEWVRKGYPEINWKGLKRRIEGNYKSIEAILHGEIESPFLAIFQEQEKDVRGNPILLLRKDHRLQYPGYYGPRGANIMLHWLLRRFGKDITAYNNATSNLTHSSAAAFVQAVLVPEMAVRLIMEDMKVNEKRAREVLEESRSIGETLNLKDYQEDIYGTGGNWVDVNNLKN
ncbi:hypothetical protein L873DRAFT_1788791 [Choiromyces venosus 120613-1]|uniref:Restriction of telomere capping protein 4 n=1 Tax=Choiromyces venosus 120613-1 TaxID=1336337 RepID=A0A3N4JRD9_9PEZI|nr:hypothetical protein L873DRAFT_1788791 [Choiromyces venosus 120613-1]